MTKDHDKGFARSRGTNRIDLFVYGHDDQIVARRLDNLGKGQQEQPYKI